METEFAPAKINLTLHVTGRREDGYHLLDSLVVFAAVGDRISAQADAALSLTITGPMSAALTATEDNLVLRAARLMDVRARIVLEKHLPVASGIGGGSTDAAAAFRLLARLSGQPLPSAGDLTRLGADVPVCMVPGALRMSGVGEHLAAVNGLPEAWLVLVNPRRPVSTPDVFKMLTCRDNAPMPARLPDLGSLSDLAGFLAAQRNDLESAATELVPEIARIKNALKQQAGCLFARMSGSGATCYGLFPDEASARAAALRIGQREPGWWAACGRMIT